MMRWGTLFSGVGGVEFGLTAAGHRAVWAVEMDATAADYHRRNHPTTTLYEADVRDVDVRELGNIDCLWCSPPCQGHSQARRSDLPVREDVWVGRDILRYVAELQPRVVMIENVPQYAKHAICREIVAGLLDMGYAVQQRILNCADYGIPQTRERLIIQARRDGQISWPAKAARRVGWYEAIRDILPPPEKPLAPWQAKRWDAAYAAMGPVYVDWQFAAARDPLYQKTMMTIRQRGEPVATITARSDRQEVVYPVLVDGQLKFDSAGEHELRVIAPQSPSPTIMAGDASSKHVVYPVLLDGQFAYGTNAQGEKALRLLAPAEPAATVMASDHSRNDIVYPVIVDNQLQQGEENGMKLITANAPVSTVMASNGSNKDVVYPNGPLRVRLTAACSARLQTFPDSVILPSAFSKAIRLIGNAVPPKLAQLLAECAEAGAEVWQVSLFGEAA